VFSSDSHLREERPTSCVNHLPTCIETCLQRASRIVGRRVSAETQPSGVVSAVLGEATAPYLIFRDGERVLQMYFARLRLWQGIMPLRESHCMVIVPLQRPKRAGIQRLSLCGIALITCGESVTAKTSGLSRIASGETNRTSLQWVHDGYAASRAGLAHHLSYTTTMSALLFRCSKN